MQLGWDRVTLGYRGAPAVLEAITLELGRGLWGVTGDGKTTLLRSAAGLLRPRRGRVLYDGDDIWENPVGYRWRIGYAPQDAEELPPLGAGPYLEYLGALKGIRVEHLHSRTREMLDALGLPDRRLDTYSAGMKRRMAVATALLNDPDILLLDDPTTGLDPEEKIDLLTRLTQLADDRIIMVTASRPEDVAGVVQGWVLLHGKGACLHADPDRRSFQDLLGTGSRPD